MPRVKKNFFSLLLLSAIFSTIIVAQLGRAADFSPSPEPVAEVEITVLPNPMDRGAPGRVVISGLRPEAPVKGSFDGKAIFFFPHRGELMGLFGADVMIKIGDHPLKVTWGPGPGEQRSLSVTVKDKSYGVRDIKVPQSQVDLSPDDLERTKIEREATIKALGTQSPDKLWSGAFIEPVNGRINSSFGRQTRLNGIMNPRPHAGADYLVPEGTPVKAPADGKVILTGNHFFAGNSVYIDHGQGLISMFFHLSRIDALEGQDIKKGDILGLVGKTGRVTGAHLHYGLYINGARIDPPVFRQMTDTINSDEFTNLPSKSKL
ncbi:MAG: M23 family metallopeptidase [Deltaproteobacteria bacterium]|nr:M23 family metallopeptidase [Deltaproteobacteria bacterium]